VSEVALLVNESVRKKQNLEQLAELEKRLMGKYPVRHPPVGVSHLYVVISRGSPKALP
jgi:hypothetical protein